MKISHLLILLGAITLTGCHFNTSPNNNSNSNNNNQNTNDNGNNNNNNQGENGNNNDNTGDNGNTNNNNDNGNNDNGNNDNNTPIVNARMQDTPILHCWNWSMNNISNNLESIKNAGFKTIQLSPMQVQKDYYNESMQNGWWKLYQPLSFTVANGNGQNVLGNKSELTSMCAKAKSLGIDVIVDVVSNHLAGGDMNTFNGGVNNYEHEIYSQNLKHSVNDYADDNNLQSIVQGHIGNYPDLKTESSVVQNRVSSLLKEYIDCGVNGFRFDAAKHIETPDDGTYASNYWPTILGAATSYAKSKNLDEPYYYGEILYQCGRGRSFSSYTKYMSVIDSSQGSAVLEAVNSKNTSKLKETYDSGVSANKLVLWAESHDTYANDKKETTNIDQNVIDKAYIIQTSRKDASTLYFARPNNMGSQLGTVGSRSFEGNAIKAINNFHNQFLGQSEKLTINNNCFVNVRGNEGVAIVNINASNSNVKVSTQGLKNGSYTDLITGSKYTVSNSEVTVNFSSGAVILVNDNKEQAVAPTLNLSSSSEIFSVSATINVNATNATSVTYSINNGTSTTLSGSTINIPSSIANGSVSVKVTASNKYGSVNKTISLFKTTALLNKSLIVYNLDSNYSYFCWSWKDSAQGQFYSPTMEGNAAGYDLGNNNMFIIVKFNKGTTSPNWDNKLAQTADYSLTQKVVDFNSLSLA